MFSYFGRTFRLLLLTTSLVPYSQAQDTSDRPKPISPPHKPVQQGFRFTATFGLNFLVNGKYSYKTAVTMPDGSALSYSGVQRSVGGTLALGASATPGGAFRRVTLGFDLNFGGLSLAERTVVPSGSVPPFSQDNLNAQVTRGSLVSSHWHPFVSPYIEHEIGSILQNRVRLGYQYVGTTASDSGSFAVGQSRAVQARYAVQFSQSSHMVRLSVHNDTFFDDSDMDHSPPPRRRSGVVQQAGVLVGTDGSVIAFVRIGPVWTF